MIVCTLCILYVNVRLIIFFTISKLDFYLYTVDTGDWEAVVAVNPLFVVHFHVRMVWIIIRLFGCLLDTCINVHIREANNYMYTIEVPIF